jgi:cell division septation protein DedD
VVVGASKGFPPYMWLTVGMLVILAVILAAWAGWVSVPYLSPMFADRSEVVETSEGVEAIPETLAPTETVEPEVTPAAGETPAVSSDLPVQAFSFSIAAYPDASEAAGVMAELRARRPDVLFYLAPVEVEGRIFHRLLAGAATERAAAEALRASLGETFGASNAERWIMRDAGEAYLLGREATLADAEARVEALGARGIPAYVLEVPGDASGPFRVYAGGYAGPQESALLGRMLDDAGLSDAELVDRVGLLPR